MPRSFALKSSYTLDDVILSLVDWRWSFSALLGTGKWCKLFYFLWRNLYADIGLISMDWIYWILFYADMDSISMDMLIRLRILDLIADIGFFFTEEEVANTD